jgi:hypothetical protein
VKHWRCHEGAGNIGSCLVGHVAKPHAQPCALLRTVRVARAITRQSSKPLDNSDESRYQAMPSTDDAVNDRVYKAAISVLFLCIAGALVWPYVRSFTLDQAKLEHVYRSAKTIEASTGVGLTYAKLYELIQQFATELLIGRDKRPTPRELEMLNRYGEALNMYRDSLTLWRIKIDGGSRYVGSADVDRVKDLYQLPVESTGTVDSERGLEIIWAKALEKLAQGDAIYNGTE